MEENLNSTVLCGANSYQEKYYFNPAYNGLPKAVKDELQILCVLFTEEVGGVLTLEFLEDGTLVFRTRADDFDFYFDEIEAGLRIRALQREKEDLLRQLELYHRVFVKGEGLEAD